MMDGDYTKRIEEKLYLIEDFELKSLIEELIKEKRELQNLAQFDTLTGLYNRRVLSKIRNYSVVVMCDVDNFKIINDTCGHDEGDNILKFVSNILVNNVRLGDIVCRFGGDEFVLIFDGCDKEVVKNRMIKVENEVKSYKNDQINLSLSIGISDYKEGQTLEDTMKEADLALYESKNNGKGRVTVFDNKNKILELK